MITVEFVLQIFYFFLKVGASVVLRQRLHMRADMQCSLRLHLARLLMAPDALSRQYFAFMSICSEAERGVKSVSGDWRSCERKSAEREVSN